MKLSQLKKIDDNNYRGNVVGFSVEVWRPTWAKHWRCSIDGEDNSFASGPRKTAAGAVSAAMAKVRKGHERVGKLLKAAK